MLTVMLHMLCIMQKTANIKGGMQKRVMYLSNSHTYCVYSYSGWCNFLQNDETKIMVWVRFENLIFKELKEFNMAKVRINCKFSINNCWDFTPHNKDMTVRNVVVEGCGTLDHLRFFNVHRNLSARASSVSASLKHCCGGSDLILR